MTIKSPKIKITTKMVEKRSLKPIVKVYVKEADFRAARQVQKGDFNEFKNLVKSSIKHPSSGSEATTHTVKSTKQPGNKFRTVKNMKSKKMSNRANSPNSFNIQVIQNGRSSIKRLTKRQIIKKISKSLEKNSSRKYSKRSSFLSKSVYDWSYLDNSLQLTKQRYKEASKNHKELKSYLKNIGASRGQSPPKRGRSTLFRGQGDRFEQFFTYGDHNFKKPKNRLSGQEIHYLYKLYKENDDLDSISLLRQYWDNQLLKPRRPVQGGESMIRMSDLADYGRRLDDEELQNRMFYLKIKKRLNRYKSDLEGGKNIRGQLEEQLQAPALKTKLRNSRISSKEHGNQPKGGDYDIDKFMNSKKEDDQWRLTFNIDGGGVGRKKKFFSPTQNLSIDDSKPIFDSGNLVEETGIQRIESGLRIRKLAGFLKEDEKRRKQNKSGMNEYEGALEYHLEKGGPLSRVSQSFYDNPNGNPQKNHAEGLDEFLEHKLFSRSQDVVGDYKDAGIPYPNKLKSSSPPGLMYYVYEKHEAFKNLENSRYQFRTYEGIGNKKSKARKNRREERKLEMSIPVDLHRLRARNIWEHPKPGQRRPEELQLQQQETRASPSSFEYKGLLRRPRPLSRKRNSNLSKNSKTPKNEDIQKELDGQEIPEGARIVSRASFYREAMQNRRLIKVTKTRPLRSVQGNRGDKVGSEVSMTGQRVKTEASPKPELGVSMTIFGKTGKKKKPKFGQEKGSGGDVAALVVTEYRIHGNFKTFFEVGKLENFNFVNQGHLRKQLKYEYYYDFVQKMGLCCSLSFNRWLEDAKIGQFVAFVEKGNNGSLVRKILERRPWWTVLDRKDFKAHKETLQNSKGSEKSQKKFNFLWTQLKDNTLIQCKPESSRAIKLAKNHTPISTKLQPSLETQYSKIQESIDTLKKELTEERAKLAELNSGDNDSALKAQKVIIKVLLKRIKQKKHFLRLFSNQNFENQAFYTTHKQIFDSNFFEKKLLPSLQQGPAKKAKKRQPRRGSPLRRAGAASQSPSPKKKGVSEGKNFQKKKLGGEAEDIVIEVNEPGSLLCTNHFAKNQSIGDKMNLFANLKKYCSRTGIKLFSMVPVTFVIDGVYSSEFKAFEKAWDAHIRAAAPKKVEKNYDDIENFMENIAPELTIGQLKGRYWIVKPAERSNRGRGIQVFNDFEKIREFITYNTRLPNYGPRGQKRTKVDGYELDNRKFVVQKYIENPLLYEGRKFDIRVFMLLTWFEGCAQVYWYNDGYVRTSSKKFEISNLDSRFVHLTNEAVQKKSAQFGRFESGNKITLEQLDEFVQAASEERVGFFEDLLPMMKVSLQSKIGI